MLQTIKQRFGDYRRRYNSQRIDALKGQVEDHYRWLFERLNLNWEQYLAYERLKREDLAYVESTGKLRITVLNR